MMFGRTLDQLARKWENDFLEQRRRNRHANLILFGMLSVSILVLLVAALKLARIEMGAAAGPIIADVAFGVGIAIAVFFLLLSLRAGFLRGRIPDIPEGVDRRGQREYLWVRLAVRITRLAVLAFATAALIIWIVSLEGWAWVGSLLGVAGGATLIGFLAEWRRLRRRLG